MYKNYLSIYDERKCIFFALGRNAMYAACMALGLKAGDEILTPAFDCDGSLQPFKILGYKLNFFRSDPYTFSVDIDNIKKKITPKTRLIHIINHFGFPQPWNKLSLLRNEIGIPFLEDNAYSLFSKFDNRLFGTFGDMSIFSLRKNLPLIDGGMLRINNERYSLINTSKQISWFSGARSISFRLTETLRSFIGLFNQQLQSPPPLYSEQESGYPSWSLRDRIGKEFSCDYLRPMSGLAKMQLGKISPGVYSDICNKKREYYLWLSQKINSIKGIKILWPTLPDGIIPFCFSFLIDRNRDSFLKTLRKKYDVMAWPTLSSLVLEQLKDFPDVELLGRRLFQINLPAARVRHPKFAQYLKDLVLDIHRLSKEYLS